MWVGLCVVGLFYIIYGAIGANYFNDDQRCGSNKDAYDAATAPNCSTLQLL